MISSVSSILWSQVNSLLARAASRAWSTVGVGLASIAFNVSGPALAHAATCGQVSSGEPTAEALASYETAVSLTKDGRYPEALAAYKRAHELSPSYVILYNLAKAAALSNDPTQAIEAYECHLELGGAEVDATRRSEVLAEIQRLRGEVALLVIEVDLAGVELFVDQRQVGVSPLLEPVTVNPGSRLVRAKGPRMETQAVQIARGGRLVVSFDLEADVAPKVEAPPFRFPAGVVGASWIATGLIGVGAAVTGVMALATSEDVSNDLYLGPQRVPLPGSELDSKIDRANGLAVATDVLITVGSIVGVAAISFSIVNSLGETDAVAPRVSISPAGLVFSGSFW